MELTWRAQLVFMNGKNIGMLQRLVSLRTLHHAKKMKEAAFRVTQWALGSIIK
jgi:hypothetical protein